MQRDDRGFAALRRPALAALFALCLTAAATAQEAGDPGAGPEEDLPRYTVELIVFTYAEGATTVGEIFVPEPLPEPFVDAEADPAVDPRAAPEQGRPAAYGDLPPEPPSAPADDAGAGSDALTPEPENPEISGFDDDLADIPLRARIELTLLPPEQYSMNEIYDKLVELDAYRPIMRAAWTQTTPPRDVSPTIRLRALGDPPPGLDGTVKLYQGRFVHLGLDIALDAESTDALDGGAYDARQSATDRAIAGSGVDGDSGVDERAPAGAAPVWSDSPFEASTFPARPVRYRIEEVRIMENGDIRYYDHPRFGVVAKLIEVEEEESEESDDKAAFAGGD